MNTLKINTIAAGLMLAMAACQNPDRHVVIKTGDNNNQTDIEYVGRVRFNAEGNAISSISPNGSVKYKHNGEELIAESDGNGAITYTVNGGEKEKEPKPEEKAF